MESRSKARRGPFWSKTRKIATWDHFVHVVHFIHAVTWFRGDHHLRDDKETSRRLQKLTSSQFSCSRSDLHGFTLEVPAKCRVAGRCTGCNQGLPLVQHHEAKRSEQKDINTRSWVIGDQCLRGHKRTQQLLAFFGKAFLQWSATSWKERKQNEKHINILQHT